jgi:hypothetical protein
VPDEWEATGKWRALIVLDSPYRSLITAVGASSKSERTVGRYITVVGWSLCQHAGGYLFHNQRALLIKRRAPVQAKHCCDQRALPLCGTRIMNQTAVTDRKVLDGLRERAGREARQ